MEISSLSITGRELKLPLPSFVRVNVFIPGRGSYYSRYLAGKKKQEIRQRRQQCIAIQTPGHRSTLQLSSSGGRYSRRAAYT